jgi:two-component system sensor kinase FixL
MRNDVSQREPESRRAFEAAAGVLLDAIDTMAMVLDPTGRIVMANRACEGVLGMATEKMLGRSPLELGLGPRDPCGDQTTGDVQLKTQSGEVRLLAWTSRVVYEPDHTVRCIVVTGTDVTEQRAAEREQRETELRFRELAENVQDFVAELTLDGVFTYANPPFETVMGYKLEEVIGHSVFEFVVPADQEDVTRAMAELSVPGNSRQTTMRVRERSGRIRTFESVARTFVTRDGKLRMAAICRDVSERSAAESELRRIDRLLALGTFAAGVAHEINNPVAAILLAAEVALERPRLDQGESLEWRTLERIASHARRCASIVRSMLDFAVQGKSERRLHDVNDLVGRALQLVESYGRERDSRLSFAPGVDLPNVRANGVEIEQVLVNLLRNAFESRDSGVTVEVETSAENGFVRISVSDDGAGIPAAASAQIWEPFYSTKLALGGTGLGLAICRRIVSEHGGEIRREDRPGGGTRFVVDLPVARAFTWRTS